MRSIVWMSKFPYVPAICPVHSCVSAGNTHRASSSLVRSTVTVSMRSTLQGPISGQYACGCVSSHPHTPLQFAHRPACLFSEIPPSPGASPERLTLKFLLRRPSRRSDLRQHGPRVCPSSKSPTSRFPLPSSALLLLLVYAGQQQPPFSVVHQRPVRE